MDVRAILRDAPTPLRSLEAEGITELDTRLASYSPNPRLKSAARSLHSLGVKHANAWTTPDDDSRGRLWLSAGSGGAVGADSIADAIEQEASDRGNQAKLAAPSDARRRHLLVRPSLSGGVAYLALLDLLQGREYAQELPRLPVLPPPITTVWAATDSGAIYVTPPDTWQVFRTPDGFWDEYRDWIEPD